MNFLLMTFRWMSDSWSSWIGFHARNSVKASSESYSCSDLTTGLGCGASSIASHELIFEFQANFKKQKEFDSRFLGLSYNCPACSCQADSFQQYYNMTGNVS